MPLIEAPVAASGGRETRRPPVPTPVWQVVVEPDGRAGAENMAVDAGLLAEAERTGAAFLRLYRFAPPCLSFGRNEAALATYDRAAIARSGIDVVRRPTGGGAVWHEQDLTYAVAAPIAAFGGLRRAYRAIHARLAEALAALGAPVTLASERSIPSVAARGAPCFAVPAGGEVLVSGRKIVGSAQVRGGDAFLQHGSVLLAGSQDALAAFRLAVAGAPPSLALRATSLATALGRVVTWVEVARAIVAAWGAGATPGAVAPPPATREPFPDPAWTWRR